MDLYYYKYKKYKELYKNYKGGMDNTQQDTRDTRDTRDTSDIPHDPHPLGDSNYLTRNNWLNYEVSSYLDTPDFGKFRNLGKDMKEDTIRGIPGRKCAFIIKKINIFLDNAEYINFKNALEEYVRAQSGDCSNRPTNEYLTNLNRFLIKAVTLTFPTYYHGNGGYLDFRYMFELVFLGARVNIDIFNPMTPHGIADLKRTTYTSVVDNIDPNNRINSLRQIQRGNIPVTSLRNI